MQKNLHWFPWVAAALTLGILSCIALIIAMLLFPPQQGACFSGAVFVREAIGHAALL